MRATMLGKTAALALSLVTVLTVLPGSAAHAQPKKPNILVIWGDDIGWYNVSAYTGSPAISRFRGRK